jgi:VIT1/CCC1 family predicted Fe2+/Mn2+ transporter
MGEEDNTDMVPRKSSLFPVAAEDIVDNALQNLDETQAKRVMEKAADEVMRLAVEKKKAEYRNSAAQEEMRNLIDNANLLDDRIGDFKITSTFETASGTTNVEIRKSRSSNALIIGAAAFAIVVLILIAVAVFK